MYVRIARNGNGAPLPSPSYSRNDNRIKNKFLSTLVRGHLSNHEPAIAEQYHPRGRDIQFEIVTRGTPVYSGLMNDICVYAFRANESKSKSGPPPTDTQLIKRCPYTDIA